MSTNMKMKTQNWLRFLRNPQTFLIYIYIYIFKKYVHQTFIDKSPLILGDFALPVARVTAHRSISGERPTAVSQHGSGTLSLISFLHRCNFLTKTFTPCSSLNTPQLPGEISKWEWSMCIFKDILQPILWHNDYTSSINSLWFSALIFPWKLDETRWDASQAFHSSPWSRFLNISSLKSLRIWGSTKTHSLIFASQRRGNFSTRYLNADPVWSIAFTKFFIRPSLMCRGGVAGFCVILLVLGVAYSSFWPSEISSEDSLLFR